ncbi:hypothetical protein LPJ77_004886, partial [Coemansia sp. RSA 2523]
MAEFAFGRSAEQELTTPYTQQFYPVLGVLNGPHTNGENLTSYGRQVARSILKYFCGGDTSERTESEHVSSGWDPVGAARGPRWQTASFSRVDDIPRRKSRSQTDSLSNDLSPRGTGELHGDGLLTPKWVERQQRRPATVISFHTLQDKPDSQLSEELARNRVCLASFGVSYTCVVIVNRSASEDGTDQRLSSIMQRGGLDQAQFAVCRPGSGPQFQAFLSELERGLFTRAAAFYADAFMHTQSKLAMLPQLPLPERPEDPASVYESMQGDSTSQALSSRLLGNDVVQRFSRYLPVRGWLVRYHFKLGVCAECAGDRDTAQRCMWLAYVHAAAYIGEIASGAYLPAEGGTPSDGWMWALNGGDSDGQRAHSLRMFGQRWDELLVLFDALHTRLVRGWIYQSLDVSALRATQASASMSGGWPYAFGGGSQRYTVTPVNRSGPQVPVPISPG